VTERRPFDGLLGAWLATLLVKVVLATAVPLFLDETYYWVWSNHLQLSYFDHPPMVAWLFALGHPFEGVAQAVRIPGVVLGHATLLVWLVLLQPFLGPREVRWWFALALLTPLIGPGSLIVTPDIPLVFFWSLALLAFLRLVAAPTPVGALLLGAALGAGFLAKYHIVIFFPLMALWLVVERRWQLLRPSLLLAGAVSFVLVSWPVWAWNASNEWISFRFQLDHGLGHSSWNPDWTLRYLRDQVLLLFPTVVYFALRSSRRAPRWLAIFGWGPLVFFLATSFRGPVEANWPTVAYPAMLALALWGARGFRWAGATAVAWAAALAVVLGQAAFGWLPVDPESVQTRELTAFSELSPVVAQYRPLYTESYQLASKLSWENRIPVYQLRGLGRPSSFFDFSQSLPTAERYFLVGRPGISAPGDELDRGYREASRTDVDGGWQLVEYSRSGAQQASLPGR